MSGARGAGAAAAAVHWRTRKQASEGSVSPQYNELLQILDRRIDRLAREKEQWRRLAAGVEILTALPSFAEQLQARYHALRGALELQVWVELVEMGRLICWLE